MPFLFDILSVFHALVMSRIKFNGTIALHHLSSILPEIDPDAAYVVWISVSLGFRQKPSDTDYFLWLLWQRSIALLAHR